ncbi:MAG: endolytic transglycosylase MltG, partial [Nitrospinae bacterium]|nr:endolytic transglycosylase MltG [Nitrospinota bacterium]
WIIAFLLVCAIGYGWFVFYFTYKYPNIKSDEIREKVSFSIERGTSLYRIIDILYDRRLIDSKFFFYIYCVLNKHQNKFKSGDYTIYPKTKRKDLVYILQHGKAKQFKITIYEGMTLKEIAEVLHDHTPFNGKIFYELTQEGKQFKYFNKYGNLEGYLFPDTYFFDKTTNERKLIQRMQKNFEEKLKKIKKDLNIKEIKNLNKIITMASIIEKESNYDKEKPLIASVFYNRLKKKNMLQTDPTVIYAINRVREFNGNLTRKDLRMESKFNTYRVKGLPPTPISNPGEESIKAALKPATSDYFYFVSMKNGRHYFSVTLNEHKKAIRKYLLKK